MNYLVYLHTIWFSQKDLGRIFEHNNKYKEFFDKLSFESLSKIKLKDEKIFEIMENYKKTDYKEIDEKLKKLKVKIVNIKDEKYPELLKNIPNPPFFLYIRWEITNNIELISIVWSRKNSPYSKVVLDKIIPDLIDNWFWIVSGWASGVDSLAHNTALNYSWITYSIIGTWIDECYPSSNRALYEKIISNSWAIISIFKLWTPPEAYNFPIRNEIIAWLSKGTLIVEAWEKSWTLITAKLALELNRDVFIIPWDINKESSIWSNKLIRDWLGKLVISSEDILNEYNIDCNNEKISKINTIFEDSIEQAIFDLLSVDSFDSSTISYKLWIDSEVIWYKLSIMEINWIIILSNTGQYSIK